MRFVWVAVAAVMLVAMWAGLRDGAGLHAAVMVAARDVFH